MSARVQNRSRQLKLGAFFSYATVVFNAIAGLVYTPWMVSCIGANDYGLYTIAITVVNLFVMDFGLSDSVTRFLSKFYANDEEEKVGAFLGLVYKLFLIIASVAAIVLVIAYCNIDFIYSNLENEQIEILRKLLAITSAYGIFSLLFVPQQGILRSNECFAVLNALQFFQKVTTVCLIVISLIMGFGVLALVTANAISVFFFSVLQYAMVKKLTSARVDWRYWSLKRAKEVFGFSIWITVAQVGQRAIFTISPSIIAVVANSWEVAVFGLAATIEGYVYSIASAINGMFMPKVSRIADHETEINVLMKKVGHFQLLVIGLVFSGFIGLGDRFVECWMGNEYAVLYWCIIALIIPSVIDLPQAIGDIALISEGFVKQRAIVYVVMAIINIVGMIILARIFGAMGGCISICIAYIIRTAGKNYLYSKHARIKLGSFYYSTYAKWFAIITPATIALVLVSRSFPIQGWFGLVFLVFAYTVIYAAISWKFLMTDYERGQIANSRITRHRK